MVTLVLLPGMDGTGDLFAEFVTALANNFKAAVIRYPKDEVLGYEDLIEFVRARLPVTEQFILVGESFSGPVAISLAAAHPPGLIGVVLCCTFARNPLPIFGPLRNAINFLPISSKASGLISPLLLGWSSSTLLRARLRSALDRVSVNTLRARLRAVLEVDCSEKLKQVHVPVLYLQASNDRIVPPSAMQHILTLKPDTRMVTLPGPHLLLQSIPKLAADEVMAFSSSCSQ
jgi:pimeloyl-[acyl-carrier protein] methyl ester esterase